MNPVEATHKHVALEQTKAAQLSRVLSRADQVLANRHITVTVNLDHDDQGGFSSNIKRSQITINVPASAWKEPSSLTSDATLMTVLGLNYHELCHSWFTVNGNWSGVHVFNHLNLLEDQRIESMAVAVYPALKSYFRLLVNRLIAVSGNADSAYLLLAGRKFVSKSVRDAFRKSCKYQSVLPQIEDVIERYKRLSPKQLGLHRFVARATELTNEFTKLIGDQAGVPNSHTEIGNSAMSGALLQGNGTTTTDQNDSIEEAIDKMKGAEGKSDQSGSGTSKDEDGSSDDDATGDGAGDGADAGSEDSADDEGASDGAGSGSSAGDTNVVYDATDPMEEVQQDTAKIMASSEVRSEIRSHTAAVMAPKVPARTSWSKSPTTPLMLETSRRFEQGLRQIMTDDIDPGWDRMHPSGRINVQRAMGGSSYDDLFDRWEPGHQDEFMVDAYVMIDSSGSMSGYMQDVCQGAWIIRHAIEALDGTVRTTSYADRATVFPDERVGPEYIGVGSMGGTDPVEALTDSYLWFHSRKGRSNKILFVLTDGAWENYLRATELLHAIRAAGVTVVLIGFKYSLHGTLFPHDAVFSNVTSDDFPRIAEKVVASIFTKNMNQIGR